MNGRDFERELFIAIDGFFGADNWKAKDGRSYQHVMDDLSINTNAEQWMIVDDTICLMDDPGFITGEVPCDTPVTPNEWDYEAVYDWLPEFDRPDVPVLPDEPEPLGWWFCIEDMIPQQMTAEQAWNYTGPFATERDAFIALIKEMDARIDALTAEVNHANH